GKFSKWPKHEAGRRRTASAAVGLRSLPRGRLAFRLDQSSNRQHNRCSTSSRNQRRNSPRHLQAIGNPTTLKHEPSPQEYEPPPSPQLKRTRVGHPRYQSANRELVADQFAAAAGED